MILFAVVGAGGFAREVMPIARQQLLATGGPGSEAVFVVEDSHDVPPLINGHRVMKMSEFLRADRPRQYAIAIADSQVRARIADAMPPQITPVTLRAASFIEGDANAVGEGSIFCAFTHITSNARIGKHFHANIYSYVAHDCVIGDYVTFAPGVKCNGRVIVEDHAYVGTGAILRDATHSPIVIGRGAVVGMGAVVTRSVAPGATVVGNPARTR